MRSITQHTSSQDAIEQIPFIPLMHQRQKRQTLTRRKEQCGGTASRTVSIHFKGHLSNFNNTHVQYIPPFLTIQV